MKRKRICAFFKNISYLFFIFTDLDVLFMFQVIWSCYVGIINMWNALSRSWFFSHNLGSWKQQFAFAYSVHLSWWLCTAAQTMLVNKIFIYNHYSWKENVIWCELCYLGKLTLFPCLIVHIYLKCPANIVSEIQKVKNVCKM